MNLVEQMYLQNPWFRDENYPILETKLPKRTLFKRFLDEVREIKQISSLTGLRRVGKSTLIKQVIRELFKDTHPSRVLYFSFDQPTVAESAKTLESLFRLYLEKVLNTSIHKFNYKIYIFLDEIQLVPFWQDIVKRYYDLGKNIKFVVSGSSSLFLLTASKESLAGRIFESYLPPLSFSEYRNLSGNSDLVQFLDFGQFPELLGLPFLEKKTQYLKEGVIEKVLEIDLAKTYGIRKLVDFERLFWSLLPNCGQIIESRKLIYDLGIKKATLFKYLHLLEKSLLVNKVLNLSGSFRSETRLLRKLYPASSNFLTLTPEPVSTGFKVECYIAQLLKAKYRDIYLFNRRGKEVDFVVPSQRLAIEVKYQNYVGKKDYETLTNFVTDKGYHGIVITKQQEKPSGKEKIEFVPLEKAEEVI